MIKSSKKTTRKAIRKVDASAQPTSQTPVRIKDYKREKRKLFTEMKKNLSQFAQNIDSMPIGERQSIQRMVENIDSTHSKLMKWWGK